MLSGNSASSNGGGIYNSNDGTAIVTGTTIMGNTAGTGGGISNRSGTAMITGTTIMGNTAGNHGGGIFSELGDSDCRRKHDLGDNSAEGQGRRNPPYNYRGHGRCHQQHHLGQHGCNGGGSSSTLAPRPCTTRLWPGIGSPRGP